MRDDENYYTTNRGFFRPSPEKNGHTGMIEQVKKLVKTSTTFDPEERGRYYDRATGE